jgi:hypothetical protein
MSQTLRQQLLMQVVAGKTTYTLALIGLCNDTWLRSRAQPDVQTSKPVCEQPLTSKMICILCIVSHALPGTTRQPYSSGGLRYMPTETEPGRIALSLCSPATLLMQMLDPNSYLFHPTSLVVHFQFCPLGRPFNEPSVFSQAQASEQIPESYPKSVEAHSSSSRTSRSRLSRQHRITVEDHQLTFILPESSWSRHTRCCIPCARFSALWNMELNSCGVLCSCF